MRAKCLLALATAAVWIVLGASRASAEDIYYIKHLGDLKLDFQWSSDSAGDSQPDRWQAWRAASVTHRRAVLDGDGEIYAADLGAGDSPVGRGGPTIAIRVPGQRVLRGWLLLPNRYRAGGRARFSIAAEEGSAKDAHSFLAVKRASYRKLLQQDIPGAAWFRHQVRKTTAELGESSRDEAARWERRFFGLRAGHSMEGTFALLSGGRALSENLQLDRVLPTSRVETPTVPIDQIEGVTVREFDWRPLVKGRNPQLDPLASYIPDDQYALLFPSFQAVLALADNAGQQGAPILAAGEARGEDAQTRERYERQLCLPLNQVVRALGPELIASVAMTGADPYLRTGADLAVLLEAKDIRALRPVVDAQVALAGSAHPDARAVRGEVQGVSYRGMRSPDRAICSYVATLDNVVAVTNSLAQLERLARVRRGRTPALANRDEYAFFRDRYRRGDPHETALLIISDKTIRRWCGPRWRIGTSRRTRAAALLSELQAEHLESLVRGTVEPGPIYTAYRLPEAGQLMLTRGGVQSSKYGGLNFQTPILELDLERATKQEEVFYRRWRDGYQRNWSNFFDPIAVRFHAAADTLAADLTVMPLIEGTEYRTLIGLSKGASIQPLAGDPQGEALLHVLLALNKKSSLFKQGVNVARTLAPQITVNPLAWMGQTVALYADKDPFWEEWAKAKHSEDFIEENFHRVPVALCVEVDNGLQLVVFLAGARAYVEQTAPGMTVWENLTHRGQPYVKVTPSERARSRESEWEEAALYYSAGGRLLIVTPNQDVLFRALDRQLAIDEAAAKGGADDPTGETGIGENLHVLADRRVLDLLAAFFREDYRRAMQRISWGNIPILNEWKRRFPDSDPVRLHEQVWGRRLVCPGGGDYRWSEEWRTMESTAYGRPGRPKDGPSLPATLQNVASATFGLTFEEHGLRARAELKTRRASATRRGAQDR